MIAPLSVAILLSGGLGVFLWWIKRKRKNLAWLPTLRVLDLPSNVLPVKVLEKPPLLPFISFVLLFLFLLAASFKVFLERPSHEKTKRPKAHFLIDISPSSQSLLDKSFLENVLEQTQKEAQVSYSFSHEPSTIMAGTTVPEIPSTRTGIKLARAFKELVGPNTAVQKDPFDVVVVVSDEDRHTWGGFDWPYFEKDFKVRHLLLQNKKPNYWIDRVQSNEEFAGTHSGIVTLRRTGSQEILREPAQGLLVSESFKGEKKMSVTFPSGQTRIEVPVELSDRIEDYVTLSLQMNSLKEDDAISTDNTFRFFRKKEALSVHLVGSPEGERKLEDPLQNLTAVFQVLGFSWTRDDKPILKPFLKDTLTVLSFADGQSLASSCPKVEQSTQHMWFMGAYASTRPDLLCQCFARHLEEDNEKRQEYCDISSRKEWVTLLSSLGAKQMGGRLGSTDEGLYYAIQSRKTKKRLSAFTFPLNQEAPFHPGQLPLLVRQILDLQGLLGQKEGQEWPRYEDYSVNLPSLDSSNTPAGESVMIAEKKELLPPPFSPETISLRNTLQDPHKDATPWITGLLLLASATLLMDTLSSLRKASILLFLTGSFIFVPKRGSADTSIVLVSEPQKITFTRLVKEVAHRTSVELQKETLFANVQEKTIFQHPWLWFLNSPKESSTLEDRLRTWLLRGGFALFETRDPPSISLSAPNQTPEPKWEPIPPDHEILRSFYLIDSLPSCPDTQWKALQADGRLMALAIPFPFHQTLKDDPIKSHCGTTFDQERMVRVFINVLLVAMTTDYKKDQVHLPEILKRLR